MIQLVVWLGVCAVLALALRRRPVHGVCLALLLWAAIPAVAAHHVTGHGVGPLAIHPATWLLLAQLVVGLATNPRPLTRTLAVHPQASVALAVFGAGVLATTALTGMNGLRLLGDQIVGPLALFWIVLAHASGYPRRLSLLRNTLITIAAFESVFAVVQFQAGRLLVYESDYATLPWFDPGTFIRWMGTTDSPLVLSLTVCVAAPLVVGLRSAGLRLAPIITMLLGVVTAQSRVGVAVMALLLSYLLFRARATWPARTLYAGLLTIATIVLLDSQLVEGISSRLTNDAGSTDARRRALRTFVDLAPDYLLSGRGLTSNYDIASEAGLRTSLESSVLMYALDVGVVLALLYFGCQVVMSLLSVRGSTMQGAPVAALVGCAVQHTFSAVGFSNLSGPLVWAVIALAVAASPRWWPRAPGLSARLRPTRRPVAAG